MGAARLLRRLGVDGTAKISAVNPVIRLLAIDIDGTLLDPQFQVSPANLTALTRAHQAGVEIVLVTGRRHQFALPIAQSLGFDLWLISSNGAVTRSLSGETFHRDLLPAATARELIAHMEPYRGNLVLTFDRDGKGALELERTDELTTHIQRWVENNRQYIEFVVPIERALDSDPIQAMFCGTIARMQVAEERLRAGSLAGRITVLKTRYDARDLVIIDVLNQGCSKGHALERWAGHRGLMREQVMAIGDNYNDIEMLEFAGVPVIMGNARHDLKQNGWRETLSNEHSGVAAAVEEVLFR
ncbi:MAG TPA: Cof-type HAD-IIB family hydrolase [Terriglobales bacterium]|nr:Cof-type HAD-IIB family hydrolase [Terriglobales bacterium]